VGAGSRLYELAGNADASTGFADAALEDIANAEFAANLLYIDGSAFVGKTNCGR
jgi:hypothetical protein